jgi:hypothetical protein
VRDWIHYRQQQARTEEKEQAVYLSENKEYNSNKRVYYCE